MRKRLLDTVANVVRKPLCVPLYSTRSAAKASTVPPRRLPPVLMVHGVLASESTYRSIMKRSDFAPKREVIGIDLRNHGKSPHLEVADGMRYEDMAADVSAFLDSEGIEKACLIGHSMGGKVAMQLALSEPEKVSELVVVDIAPINYTPGKDSGDPLTATRAMQGVDLPRYESRSQIDAALQENGIKSEAVRQFVMTNLTTSGGGKGKYEWKLNLPAIEKAFPGIMAFPEQDGKKYEGPTCLIRGGKSKYVPFDSMKAFVSLFPKTKLVTISEAGHWLQAQSPDEFCRSVNDFLAD